jgi:hypothetical protein
MKRKELVGRVERALEDVEQSVVAASPAPVDEKVETDFEDVQPVTVDSSEPTTVSDLSLETLAHVAFGAESEPQQVEPVIVTAPAAASLETLALAAFDSEPVSAEPISAEPDFVEAKAVEEEPVVVEAASVPVESVAVNAPAVEVPVATEEVVDTEESVVSDAPAVSESTQVVVDESPVEVDEPSAPVEVVPEPASTPAEEPTFTGDASLASSEVTIKAPTSSYTEDLALSFPAPEALASSGILATPAGATATDDDEVDTFLLPAERPLSPRRVPTHTDDSSEDEALLVDGMSSGEEWSDLEPEEK